MEEDGKRTIDRVDFKVLEGDEIDAVDFLVKDFVGSVGNVPAPQIGPDQYITVGTRLQGDGSERFRAAGRLFGVRAITVERQGSDNKTIDATTDLGDGTRPLRAIVDIDERGPGADADASG